LYGIIGGVVGFVFLLALALAFYFFNRRKNQTLSSGTAMQQQNSTGGEYASPHAVSLQQLAHNAFYGLFVFPVIVV
jgi:hypothetical protein